MSDFYHETMRNLLLSLFLCIPSMLFASAGHCVSEVSVCHEPADGIIGVYFAEYEGEQSNISIFRNDDGTYSARVIWVDNRLDADGNVRTDEKNPDKSKRNTPCDEIVLIEDMAYDAAKNCWGNAKIYDPVRGIKANVTCSFDNNGRLRVRGSLMGIGMSVYWDKIE